MKRRILMIYTGGTIGMMKEYGSEALKPFDFSNIVTHIPEIKLIDVTLEVHEFDTPIDSSDVNLPDWIKLASIITKNYPKYDGFVVLHGTDTMSYTSSMMSFMLQGLQKPVIFTGSQLPIGELRTDAKQNLITSLYYSSLYEDGLPVIREVCLYFEYSLYRANRTTKFSSEHFDAFISPNYPALGEAGVRLDIFHEYLLTTQQELVTDTVVDNNVEIFTFFPGKPTRLFNHLIEDDGIKGIILRTFGSGNIPSDKETIQSIYKAKEMGKELVVITQCVRGRVSLGKYHTGAVFKELGVINGHDITVEAASTKLMWLLGKNYSSEKLKTEFEKNIAGEITLE